MKVVVSVVLFVFVPVTKLCVLLLVIARRANKGPVQTTVWGFILMKTTLNLLGVLRKSLSFGQMKVVVGFVQSFAKNVVLP
jgi:hypothetical protein|tara:strand:- start:359 stop:601 length:243 start_codon:yes stop_codon:yes gene_type:complete